MEQYVDQLKYHLSKEDMIVDVYDEYTTTQIRNDEQYGINIRVRIQYLVKGGIAAIVEDERDLVVFLDLNEEYIQITNVSNNSFKDSIKVRPRRNNIGDLNEFQIENILSQSTDETRRQTIVEYLIGKKYEIVV